MANFVDRLAALPPAKRGHSPSPLRAKVRDGFDAITAARKRGVSWGQIAELMAADGLVASEDHVRSTYHVERYSRGIQPKPQRSTRAKPTPVTTPPAARYAAPLAPTALPAPAGDPAAVAEARLARLDAKTLARSPDACTPDEAEARLARLRAQIIARSPR